MAPLWGLFQPAKAYQLTHLLNAFVMASSVFPAYLLARRILRSAGWALVTALLCIALPWSVMAGTMMTENAAYPLSLWAVFAMQVAATRPGVRADVIALGALAGAFLGRTQLIVIAPALPIVLLAQGLRYPVARVGGGTRRVRATLLRHRMVISLVGVVALVVLVRTRTLLGNAPQSGPFVPNGFATAREMLSYVVIAIAMVPLATSAAWVVATLARPLDSERHAYAVILLVCAVMLTIVIGGGSVSFTSGINDRYLAYLAPLLMIGMMACLLERRSLTALIALGGVGGAWVVWRAKLEEVGPTFVSPTAAWHLVLYGRAPRIGKLVGLPTLTSPHLMGAFSVGSAVAIAMARRWVRPGVVAAIVAVGVGGYCVVETMYTRAKLQRIQPAASYASGRDWVDKLLPYGSHADVLLSGLSADAPSATATWWDLTFWNAKVTGMRYLKNGPTPWPDQAFPLPFAVDPNTGATTGLAGGYVVAGAGDRRFGFRGQQPVGPPHGNLQVWSLPAPVDSTWQFLGAAENGAVPPAGHAIVRIFGDGTAGSRTVSVVVGAGFGSKAATPFEVLRGGNVVQSGRATFAKPVTVSVRIMLPARGHVDLTLVAGREARANGALFYGVGVPPPLPN